MPKSNTNRSQRPEVKAKVLARLKGDGFNSLHDACIEKRVSYQLARRAIEEGLTPLTTLRTVSALERLGIYDLVRSTA